jgi:hypothetical protein
MPKLLLAATLLDLALQLIRAEQGVGAEQMVRSFANNFFAPRIDLHYPRGVGRAVGPLISSELL